MSHEVNAAEILEKKFPFLSGKLSSPKDKRVIGSPLTVEEFEKVVVYAHSELGYFRASHVVGTDDGDTFGLLYILADEDGNLLALRESVPREEPRAKSISGMYPSIILHERELVDLFGIQLSEMPDGPRYPLPDGWPEGNYPMRKDWDPKRFDKNTLTYNKPAGEEASGNE